MEWKRLMERSDCQRIIFAGIQDAGHWLCTVYLFFEDLFLDSGTVRVCTSLISHLSPAEFRKITIFSKHPVAVYIRDSQEYIKPIWQWVILHSWLSSAEVRWGDRGGVYQSLPFAWAIMMQIVLRRCIKNRNMLFSLSVIWS